MIMRKTITFDEFSGRTLQESEPTQVDDQEAREILWTLVMEALRDNARIQAIRHIKEATGLGLKDAKDVGERLWAIRAAVLGYPDDHVS